MFNYMMRSKEKLWFQKMLSKKEKIMFVSSMKISMTMMEVGVLASQMLTENSIYTLNLNHIWEAEFSLYSTSQI